jgi:hypothetical protein
MLLFAGRPLPHHYGYVIADHLGYSERQDDWYEPPGRHPKPAGALYSPAIYCFDTHIKVFIPQSRFDLFMTDEPLSGSAFIHCRMAGEAWDDEALMALCQRVQDLPYGGQVSQALIEQADFLDLHPEYRGLPKIADRHLPPGQIEVDRGPAAKPKDWDWV